MHKSPLPRTPRRSFFRDQVGTEERPLYHYSVEVEGVTFFCVEVSAQEFLGLGRYDAICRCLVGWDMPIPFSTPVIANLHEETRAALYDSMLSLTINGSY